MHRLLFKDVQEKVLTSEYPNSADHSSQHKAADAITD
jgi:hypothetical protein